MYKSEEKNHLGILPCWKTQATVPVQRADVIITIKVIATLYWLFMYAGLSMSTPPPTCLFHVGLINED